MRSFYFASLSPRLSTVSEHPHRVHIDGNFDMAWGGHTPDGRSEQLVERIIFGPLELKVKTEKVLHSRNRRGRGAKDTNSLGYVRGKLFQSVGQLFGVALGGRVVFAPHDDAGQAAEGWIAVLAAVR